ncbi:LacI family DNA-binding transcriptional regulator [Aestuariimicrobium ganziense]|uniref:LacI family DNA-binding transcriptional regulator n=1 Tax=Aestuariimicrobium ganziense TaxID=2773677 RepID=UPI0019431BBF|nr:LacI family DNA-binding transcriptional regulator [Aestuariimicrobium ganziense]
MASRRTTLSDVARRAGVSVATASFVLAGRDGRPAGSPETRRRVQQAAAELGYIPNEYARAMRTGRTGAIALALGAPRDPWTHELSAVVSEHAQQAGLTTVALVDESWYEFLQGRAFDASFVTGADATADGLEQVADLARRGQHLVVFSEFVEAAHHDVISSGAGPAVHMAHAALRTRHAKVHFLGTRLDRQYEPPVVTRLERFLNSAAEHGDDPHGLLRDVPATMGAARLAALDWLRSDQRPTAVVAQTGYLALALQAAAVQAGMSMPDDLEIISIGDIPQASSLFGPISYYGAAEVFQVVAEITVQRALNPHAPYTKTVLTWRYHPGETTWE